MTFNGRTVTIAGFGLAALLGLFVLCQAQAPNRPALTAVAADSAKLKATRDSDLVRMEHAYREILEKTNAQLGLWTNPYGLFVAALGVLFTVGAIVVGVLIFRQGRDYRDLIQRSITEYQNIVNAFIEEKNKQIEILKQGYSEHIDRLSNDLEKATGAQRKQIEAEIGQLRQFQKALKPVEPPSQPWYVPKTILGQGSVNLGGPAFSTSTLMQLGSLFAGSTHVCSKCGTTYSLPKTALLPLTSAKCPTCGTVDKLP